MATTKQVKLPDLQLQTPRAEALGVAIHNELVARGFTVGDDKVMAEYVLIMLINKKSPEQVDKELSDFIGPEMWDSSFVDWLFEEAVKENPGASQAVAEPQPTPAELPPAPQPIPTLGDDRGRGRDIRGAAGPSRIYNQAVGGAQKRTSSNRSPSPGSNGPNKAPRKSDAPSGPRSMRGDQPEGNRGRSLKDRLGGFSRDGPGPNPNQGQMGPGNQGPRFPNQNPGMPPPMGGPGPFGPDMQNMQGMFPNNPMTEMLVQQNALLQGLLHTMANGMPGMMPMGGMPGMMPGGGPGFNGMPMGPGFQGDGRGRGGSPARRGGRQHQDGDRQGNHGLQNPSALPGNMGPGIQAPTPIPAGQANLPPDLFDRPVSPTLCKFGVNCSNALCRYSHPSAAATVESGVVLTTEACPKGRRCDDKDCTLSHPSPGKNMSGPMPQPRTAAQNAAPSSNLSAVPCKFGVNCTRPNCPFQHPASTKSSSSSSVPCKFGIHCTRADCMFSHPPGRVNPASYKGLSGTGDMKSHANRSVRFNTNAAEFVPKQAGAQADPAAAGSGEGAGQASDANATTAGSKEANPAEVVAAV